MPGACATSPPTLPTTCCHMSPRGSGCCRSKAPPSLSPPRRARRQRRISGLSARDSDDAPALQPEWLSLPVRSIARVGAHIGCSGARAARATRLHTPAGPSTRRGRRRDFVGPSRMLPGRGCRGILRFGRIGGKRVPGGRSGGWTVRASSLIGDGTIDGFGDPPPYSRNDRDTHVAVDGVMPPQVHRARQDQRRVDAGKEACPARPGP